MQVHQCKMVINCLNDSPTTACLSSFSFICNRFIISLHLQPLRASGEEGTTFRMYAGYSLNYVKYQFP